MPWLVRRTHWRRTMSIVDFSPRLKEGNRSRTSAGGSAAQPMTSVTKIYFSHSKALAAKIRQCILWGCGDFPVAD
jgi:hypothetical protein